MDIQHLASSVSPPYGRLERKRLRPSLVNVLKMMMREVLQSVPNFIILISLSTPPEGSESFIPIPIRSIKTKSFLSFRIECVFFGG
jgi:hypothetical protein